MSNYILDADGLPVMETDVLRWAEWFETRRLRGDHVIAETVVGDVRVSTVFLGIDHDFTGGGPPILWETMVFGGPHDMGGQRYSSLDDAKVGHEMWVLVAQGKTTPEAIHELDKALA